MRHQALDQFHKEPFVVPFEFPDWDLGTSTVKEKVHPTRSQTYDETSYTGLVIHLITSLRFDTNQAIIGK